MREFDDCVQKTKKLEVERTKNFPENLRMREGKENEKLDFFFKIETYFYT